MKTGHKIALGILTLGLSTLFLSSGKRKSLPSPESKGAEVRVAGLFLPDAVPDDLTIPLFVDPTRKQPEIPDLGVKEFAPGASFVGDDLVVYGEVLERIGARPVVLSKRIGATGPGQFDIWVRGDTEHMHLPLSQKIQVVFKGLRPALKKAEPSIESLRMMSRIIDDDGEWKTLETSIPVRG